VSSIDCFSSLNCYIHICVCVYIHVSMCSNSSKNILANNKYIQRRICVFKNFLYSKVLSQATFHIKIELKLYEKMFYRVCKFYTNTNIQVVQCTNRKWHLRFQKCTNIIHMLLITKVFICLALFGTYVCS
jgi:hypothetical protein